MYYVLYIYIYIYIYNDELTNQITRVNFYKITKLHITDMTTRYSFLSQKCDRSLYDLSKRRAVRSTFYKQHRSSSVHYSVHLIEQYLPRYLPSLSHLLIRSRNSRVVE